MKSKHKFRSSGPFFALVRKETSQVLFVKKIVDMMVCWSYGIIDVNWVTERRLYKASYFDGSHLEFRLQGYVWVSGQMHPVEARVELRRRGDGSWWVSEQIALYDYIRGVDAWNLYTVWADELCPELSELPGYESYKLK